MIAGLFKCLYSWTIKNYKGLTELFFIVFFFICPKIKLLLREHLYVVSLFLADAAAFRVLTLLVVHTPAVLTHQLLVCYDQHHFGFVVLPLFHLFVLLLRRGNRLHNK